VHFAAGVEKESVGIERSSKDAPQIGGGVLKPAVSKKRRSQSERGDISTAPRDLVEPAECPIRRLRPKGGARDNCGK